MRLLMSAVKKLSCNVEAFNLQLEKFGTSPNVLLGDFAKIIETIQQFSFSFLEN